MHGTETIDVGSTTKQRYRTEIDGLRTLAVLPVVFFHSGIPGFSGGFVGVDIFFVISGYLITGILFREAQSGQYSIFKFYERRIRRIFPALFTMLAATVLAGLFILLPGELTELGRELAATTFFTSNVLFWLDNGYFDAASETKPLLHTWSLAVEEQFYIFWPILLALITKWRINMLLPLVSVIAVLSFVLSVLLLQHKPELTFYLLPTRAWELAIGGIIAIAPRFAGRGREPIALLGVAAIMFPICVYTSSTPFPGVAALLPCLGAAGILFAAEGTVTARALSLAPMRGIGLISYSLYLWHWPVLVYGAYLFGRPLPLPIAVAAIMLSMLLATLSWWLVEGPVRRRASIRTVWLIGAACLGGGLLIAALTLFGRGYPDRYSSRSITIIHEAEAQNSQLEKGYTCSNPTFEGVSGFGPCTIGAPAAHPSLIVIGDSHGMAMRGVVDQVMHESGNSGTLVSVAGCPPLIGLERVGVSSNCAAREARIRKYVVEAQPKAVLIIGSWRGVLFSKDTSYHGRQSYDRASRLSNISMALADTVADYQRQGIKVGILLPVPGARDNVPSTMARGLGLPLAWSRQRFQSDFTPFYAAVAAARPDVVEDLALPICLTGTCIVATDRPIYMDDNHINEAGARIIFPIVRRAIKHLLEPATHG
jgi:peptidoglycan/LPS O-acetylase OafA/YrhL